MKFLKAAAAWLVVLCGLAASALLVPLELIPERFFDQVTNIVFGLGLVMAVLAIILVVIERVAKKTRLFDWEEDTRVILFGLFTSLLVCWALVGWICALAAAVYNTVLWAMDPATGRFPALVLCLPLTFAAGLLLFAMRLHLRTLYGVVEVAVGLFVALWLVISASPDKPLLDLGAMVGFLTAGVYVVVRGMDNIHTGWKAPKPDPFLKLLGFVFSRRNRTKTPAEGAVDT